MSVNPIQEKTCQQEWNLELNVIIFIYNIIIYNYNIYNILYNKVLFHFLDIPLVF